MIPALTWAIPDVITQRSSDWVIPPRKGRTVRGASVWPMKMEAATFTLSAPLAPMRRVMTTAKALTTTCMTPRW